MVLCLHGHLQNVIWIMSAMASFDSRQTEFDV